MPRHRTGTIRTLPSGKVQAIVRDPATDRQVPLGVFADEQAARKAIELAHRDIDRGLFDSPTVGKIRLAAYAEEFLERPLAPRTVEEYRRLLRNYVVPSLGRYRLEAITPIIVRRWHTAMVNTNPESMQPAKAYRLLHAIMAMAIRELMPRAVNPCNIEGAGVEYSPERPHIDVPEVIAIATAAKPHRRALILVAGVGGLRLGELASLHRSDCDVKDMKSARVHVRRAHDGKGGAKRPKGTAVAKRPVPISATTAMILAEHLENHVGPEPDAIVFAGPKGGPLRSSNWSVEFRQACADSGAELPANLHFHDLRGTASTMFLAEGASIRDVMHLLGHSTERAAKRYQHSSSSRLARLANQLDDRIAAELLAAQAKDDQTVVAFRRSRKGS